MLMQLNKKSSIISNERRLTSCPFNVLFSHQQNEHVLSFPLLLAFSTKTFYLVWFSNFSFNNYWAKSLLSFVLATLQRVRLSLGNHFCTKVIPSSWAWMLAVTNATSLVFSPCEWCGKRRNTDVCGSAGIIWLTKCTESCSKEDFFPDLWGSLCHVSFCTPFRDFTLQSRALWFSLRCSSWPAVPDLSFCLGLMNSPSPCLHSHPCKQMLSPGLCWNGVGQQRPHFFLLKNLSKPLPCYLQSCSNSYCNL